MKKNIVTIFILALGILNLVLNAVIVFAVVPNTIKTNNFISKVAASIDLELGDPSSETGTEVINISDLEVYQIEDDLTINLKKEENDSSNHYALISVSLSVNKTSKDYEALNSKIADNESFITEIITEEFSKYTANNVTENKDAIKAEILGRIQTHFNSDFITGMSVGKLIVE